MKNVLIFTHHYLPGFKGGGPIRTVSNIVETLGDEFNFSIVTSDRDLGDGHPYQCIETDKWHNVGRAKVYYTTPKNIRLKISKIIEDFEGIAIHLNSFFSFQFSILPLLIARATKPNLHIIIGPRGEFSLGALALKPLKKKVYIYAAKVIGLYRNVIWHASTQHEADDIRRVMGQSAIVRTAVDIVSPSSQLEIKARDGHSALRLIFVSRISPKKNILGAIHMLRTCEHPVHFHVYGPSEDESYLKECISAATGMPSHVKIEFLGELRHEVVSHKMAEYDLFFMPTLGENFGHVIAEALLAGLPVLISDNTPWRDLESKGVGWDLSLLQPERFSMCINMCATMPASAYLDWRHRIRAWALEHVGRSDAIVQNRELFMSLER